MMMTVKQRIENRLFLMKSGLIRRISFRTETRQPISVSYQNGHWTFCSLEGKTIASIDSLDEAVRFVEEIKHPEAFAE